MYFNIWDHLLFGPAYQCLGPQLKSPVFLSSPPHIVSTHTDALNGQPQTLATRPSFIPILPQPPPVVSTISSSNGSSSINNNNNNTSSSNLDNNNSSNNNNTTNNNSNSLATSEENASAGLSVPTSMLSPAPSEKCPSDSDSCHNEAGHSPHASDHDIDCEENMTSTDAVGDLKYETSGLSDDGVCRLLWEFIYQLLQDCKYSELVCWESAEDLTFRINNPMNLAELWGMQKNRTNMTYEKLSRALRYYYKMQIIKKVPGKRLTYQFLQHPTKIRKGQRGARPHSSRMLGAGDPNSSPADPSIPDMSNFHPSQTSSMSPPSGNLSIMSSEFSLRMHSPKQLQISEMPPDNLMAASSEDHVSALHRMMNAQESLHHQTPGLGFASGKLEITARGSPTRFFHQSETSSAQQSVQGAIVKNSSSNQDKDATDVAHNHAINNIALTSRASPLRHQEFHSQHIGHARDKLSPLPMVTQRLSPSGAHVYDAYVYIDRDQAHPPTDDRPPMNPLYDRSFPLYKSAHDLTQGMDTFRRSSSASPTYPSPRSSTPSRGDILRNPGHQKHRPYPHQSPRHYSHRPHSPPSPRGPSSLPPQSHYHYEEPSSFRSVHSTNSQQQPQHRNEITEAHRYTPEHLDNNKVPSSTFLSHSVKHETFLNEQDEPEDLSMKPCPRKGSASIGVKSELEFSHVSEVKDANTDSPCSCSSDSAYGSDRADFGKDNGIEEPRESSKPQLH